MGLKYSPCCGALFFVSLLLLSGCMSPAPQQPKFSDALSGIASTARSGENIPAKPRVGLILSDNTEISLSYLKALSMWYEKEFHEGWQIDPVPLVQSIANIMNNYHLETTLINNFSEGLSAHMDQITILDIRYDHSGSSFGDDRLLLSLYYYDPDGSSIGTVAGSAKIPIPYPSEPVFYKLAQQAASNLDRELSKRLSY